MGNPKDIMTVADLRAALADLPADMPIGLGLHSYTWFAPCNRVSHGPVRLTRARLRYSNGGTEDVAIVHTGTIDPIRTSYGATPIEDETAA